MHFLVSRGFELAILYILKRYRASVNNLNPKLVKPLFIYFLGLKTNKFPGRPLIHRPNPSIHLFGLLEETLLNTECINYFFLLPVPLHHPPISPLFSADPSMLLWCLPRGAALSTAKELQSRGQGQQGTHWEHSCIARVVPEQGPAVTDGGWYRQDLCPERFRFNILLLYMYDMFSDKLFNIYLCLNVYWDVPVREQLKFTRSYRNNSGSSPQPGQVSNHPTSPQLINPFLGGL